MPRYVHERIEVRLQPGGAAPAGFTWQGRRYVVQSVEACWKAIGPWWDDDGERTYFRVIANLHGTRIQKTLEIENWKLKNENRPYPTPNTQHPTPIPAGVYELCYDHENE